MATDRWEYRQKSLCPVQAHPFIGSMLTGLLKGESGTIITPVIFTTKKYDYWKEKKKPFFFLIIRLL